MFRSVFILIFSISVLSVSAQIFQTKLLDAETLQNIDNALVFISNSSISTISDSAGNILLDRSALPNSEIVISHISYETKYLQASNLKEALDTIYLSPTNHALEEVVLKSKGSRKRKKWLQRFTKSLLGSTENGNQSKLLNPEVVLFQEEDGILTAIVEDHLIFRNDKLGYNLWFVLEEYALEKNDDVLYSGKVFFDEFEKVSDTQIRNRKKVFESSSRKFFKDYASGSYDTLQYTVALATLQGDGFFHYVGKMNRNKLIYYKEESDLVELNFRRFLRIENRAINTNQKNDKTPSGFGNISLSDVVQKKAKNQQDLSDYAVSYLKSKSNKIVVNKEGVIQNQRDIEEYGYWSELRLADRLPDDFKHIPN